MLKNTGKSKYNEQQNNETHFSYKEYRKKVKRRPYKDITVFISVLIIGILIFLGFAKILSPNVDVEIAGKDEYLQYEDETPKGTVDERLKHLQAEDEANAGEESLFATELDEAVVLPSKVKKTISELEDEMLNDKSQTEKVETPSPKPAEVVENVKASVATKQETKAPEPIHSQPSYYKVVVGNYATEKQAEVAKSIMQDAGLGVIPMVKKLGSSYTLQVGVFSSKEKAQQSVNNLLKNNFPARIVE